MSNVDRHRHGWHQDRHRHLRRDGQLLDRSVVATDGAAPGCHRHGLAERARRLEGFARAHGRRHGDAGHRRRRGRAWPGPRDSVSELERRSRRRTADSAFGLPAVAMFDGYAATLGRGDIRRRAVATRAWPRSSSAPDSGPESGSTARSSRDAPCVAGAVGWNRWPLPTAACPNRPRRWPQGPGILAAALARRPRGGLSRHPRGVRSSSRRETRGAVTPSTRRPPWRARWPGTSSICWHRELVVWSGGVGSRADFSRPGHRGRAAELSTVRITAYDVHTLGTRR